MSYVKRISKKAQAKKHDLKTNKMATHKLYPLRYTRWWEHASRNLSITLSDRGKQEILRHVKWSEQARYP